jgi:hypothetical protein
VFADPQAADSRFHVLPVLLTLAPTLIGTGLKWMQDNSKNRQRTQLADRLTGLTKVYTEQCQGDDSTLVVARTALAAEIAAVCSELQSLQLESKRAVHRSVSTWVTDMFLLFRPHGYLAWLVHLGFYGELLVLPLGLLGILVDHANPNTDTKSALLGFFFLGLIMFGLQRWAIRLRRRSQPAPPPPRPVVIPPPVQA